MKKISYFAIILILLMCISCSTSSSNNSSTDSDNEADTIDFKLPTLSSSNDYNDGEEILIDLTNKQVTNNNGFVLFDDEALYVLQAGSYNLSGKMEGRVIISCEGDVELVLSDCKISSSNYSPIVGYNLDNLDISAKKDTTNYIIDNRASEGSFNSAIYSDCDLTIKGKGSLNVTTTLNNGIHTKNDLKIKNLTLNVLAVNNAIKGNDSIAITNADVTAISTSGDALKTTNSDISAKGNQRGSVTISGGNVNLYAATDGIDASYDVVISDEANINILTDSYSKYSNYVSSNSNTFYIRYDNNISSLSLTVYYSDGSSKALSGKSVNGRFGRSYMSFSISSDVVSFKISEVSRNQSFETDVLNVNSKYDCLSINYRNGNIYTNYETYSTNQMSHGGMPPGGMNDGNQNKSEYSSKGIKSDNEVNISSGNITISSHDDGIQASGGVTLENGSNGVGSVNISGGNVTITSDDDGIHADYCLNITGGYIKIIDSYEGLEANIITIDGGVCEIKASNDGINATKISEDPYIYFKSGTVYINADGDGIDSNGNIVMTGGYLLAIGPTNGGNGVLDFDGSFTMSGGYLLACGCSGMDQKPTLKSGVVGSTAKTNVSGKYITLNVSSSTILELYVSKNNINYIVYAGYGSDVTYSVNSKSSISSLEYGVSL